MGARRRDRRRLEARPADVPELRGRDVGAAGRRRAAAPRRPQLAPATDGNRRPGRAPARRAPRARGSRRAVQTPADERDDARRLGAAEVGDRGAGGRSPGSRSGIRRARSCSCPEPSKPRRHRRDRLDPLLRAAGRLARGLLRGDRAAPARQAVAGAGLDRAAAAHLRPADLLPLARRCRRGERRSSSSSSTSATGSSSTRPSGAACRRPTRELAGSSTGSRSPTSPGRARSAGAAGSHTRWPDIRSVQKISVTRAEGGRAAARRLAALAAAAEGRARAPLGEPARARRLRRRGGAAAAGVAAERERPALRRARRLRPRPDLRGGCRGGCRRAVGCTST